MRKKEILPFVTTQMDLEGIILSERIQIKTRLAKKFVWFLVTSHRKKTSVLDSFTDKFYQTFKE